jgi:hypothetical protein
MRAQLPSHQPVAVVSTFYLEPSEEAGEEGNRLCARRPSSPSPCILGRERDGDFAIQNSAGWRIGGVSRSQYFSPEEGRADEISTRRIRQTEVTVHRRNAQIESAGNLRNLLSLVVKLVDLLRLCKLNRVAVLACGRRLLLLLRGWRIQSRATVTRCRCRDHTRNGRDTHDMPPYVILNPLTRADIGSGIENLSPKRKNYNCLIYFSVPDWQRGNKCPSFSARFLPRQGRADAEPCPERNRSIREGSAPPPGRAAKRRSTHGAGVRL